MIVGLAYISSRQLFTQMTIGIMNPTLVFAMFIFKKLIYNEHSDLKLDDHNMTEKYYWIYACSSTMAAPIAGIIARFLMKTQLENEYIRIG